MKIEDLMKNRLISRLKKEMEYNSRKIEILENKNQSFGLKISEMEKLINEKEDKEINESIENEKYQG